MKQSIWRDDPPIQYAEEEPYDITLTPGEAAAILLLALVLVVVGFVLGFGVASWLI